MVSSTAMSDSFLEVAIAAARQAGALLHDHFGATRCVNDKGTPTNLVTEMDRRTEALIIESIRARFPGHAVLAEEGGRLEGSATHRWIVDPPDSLLPPALPERLRVT